MIAGTPLYKRHTTDNRRENVFRLELEFGAVNSSHYNVPRTRERMCFGARFVEL